MSKTPFSMRLDDALRKALEDEAEIAQRSPAQFAEHAIRAMLDAKAAKRAAIASALDEADRGYFISADAMTTWIESWDTADERPIPIADITPDGE